MSEWFRYQASYGFLEVGPLSFVLSDIHGLIVCWKRVVKWELRP